MKTMQTRTAGPAHFLDVCGLVPPEPMERIMVALSAMARGTRLCALIEHEPYPLYRLLDQNGYAHATHVRDDRLFEILIWHADAAQ